MTDFDSRSQVFAWPSHRLWIMLTTLILQASVIVAVKPASLTSTGLHHLRHALRSHQFAMLATALVVIATFCAYLVSQIVVLRAAVYNAPNPRVLNARELPNFIHQDPDAPSLLQFRRHLDSLLALDYPDSLAKAVAIRQWVRRQQSQDECMWLVPARCNHENPHRLLVEQRSGVPGSCRRFSYILLGALLSAGFDARIVSFTNSLRRRGVESHVAVEAWIEEARQWVLLDPTCDAIVLIRGQLASAFDLCQAVSARDFDEIAFERSGSILEPHPSIAIYARYCRHLFVALSNAVFDGYGVRMIGAKSISFLHYSEEAPYPELRKQLLLGISANGLFLSAVFWLWTFLSLGAE